MALHAQAEGLDPLEEQEGIEGGDGCTDVGQVLEAGLQHEAGREEGLGELAEDQPVVARVRLGEGGEPAAALVVERPAVDDDATDRRAMAPMNLVAE